MSEAQYMAALARASETQRQNRVLRRHVKDGTLSVMSAIVAPTCQNLYVYKVLGWQPHWGPRRGETLLNLLAIRPAVTCGNLTPRERSLISKWLRGSADQRAVVEWNATRVWVA